MDDQISSVIIAQLLFLQSESPRKPIHLYINTPGLYQLWITTGRCCVTSYKSLIYVLKFPLCTCINNQVTEYTLYNYTGGSVTAGLGIYDTIQYIRPPVATWCVGQACSMGSFLLASGTEGMRHSLPNSRIMVHQPLGGAQVRCAYDSSIEVLNS